MAQEVTMLQANSSLLDSNLLMGKTFDGVQFTEILEKNTKLLDVSFCSCYVSKPKDDMSDLFKKYCGLQL